MGNEQDNDEANRSTSGEKVPQKKFRGRRKAYNLIPDVDDKIARLKLPSEALSTKDFERQYQLQMEGDNPQHFRKGKVHQKMVLEIFGDKWGNNRLQSYV